MPTTPRPPSPEPLRASLSGADDRIRLSHWMPPQQGIFPRIRIRSRWFNTLWVLPIGAAALLCLIALAQSLRELPGVTAFIQSHPGIAQSAPSVDSGFPEWLQVQHFLNMFFMLFIMRAGLQILADHPRLYWSRDCTPGSDWFRFQVPVPVDEGWTRYNGLQQLSYFITIFVAAPVSIVTGLMQSPAISNALGWFGRLLNRQAMRSVHFISFAWFVGFVLAHGAMVFVTGIHQNTNHMFGGVDDASWTGFPLFLLAMAILFAAWLVASPLTIRYARLVQRTGAFMIDWLMGLAEGWDPRSQLTRKDISPCSASCMARLCGYAARTSWVSRWSNGSPRSNSFVIFPTSAPARAATTRTPNSTVTGCRFDRSGKRRSWQRGSTGNVSVAGVGTMIVRNILPRARERLAVIEADAPVREAALLMSRPHTDLVVVCDHGDMVGVLTKTDIVGQIGRCMGAGCSARVDGIMTRDVIYCRTDEILLDVWSVMRERNLQRVPILDEARRPLGIIYAREALQALLSEVENEDALLRDYISGVGYR